MTPHRIALVDDAPEVRALLRLRLRLTGAFTVVAEGGNGHDAVRIAREEHPDLMLLDVSMPELGGLDAIGAVRGVSPDTKVVLYSGFDEEGLEARALELGAAAFVQKSAHVEELIAALTAIADAANPAEAGRLAPEVDAQQQPLPPDGLEPGGVVSSDPRHDGDASRREGEAILTEHVERFRAVFDQAAIGIGTLTLTGQLVRANRELARLLGASMDDVVGLALPDVVPGADRGRVTEALSTAVDEGVVQVEHRLSGTDRVVTSTVAAVRDSGERPLYLLLQSQDVSAQRSTERALFESEERFRLLVESVMDYAIFMLDPAGRIASWNRGAERLKGYRAEEALGQHFRLFYTPEAKASKHPEYELECAVRDGRYEEEGWRVRKDGTRFWANVVITALRERGELVGFAKVTRDVTQQRTDSQQMRAAASELAEANSELAEANVRLGAAAAERANFLAITAHEMRSPLAVVAGSASMLVRHWAALEEDERVELLGSIESSAQQMRRMLDELLLAARLDAGRVTLSTSAVQLRPALEGIVHQHLGTLVELGAGSDVQVVCPADLELVTDLDQLRQIVTNYVSNATRYGAAPLVVRAWKDGGVVKIAVEDSGPGVPDAVAGQIFDEMFLKGGGRMGTGLGLYIVRRLARALGGDAWYERTGDVTRFGVTLPA
ncbi:PAS domain S-box protein [Cellulomonas fimi]|uniref:Sensor-like histidine kinase SenX3 n=1 Tax=Cellulomonas fimi TaxID=1708 RepID=A0A7Y0LXK9_CELFI|nr:PAS domain S-box protein [Cellulomonas fimi]NMR19746.1 PAS domain S-box protein [Cellulomonas fimi]